jgi:hypothetical protein
MAIETGSNTSHSVKNLLWKKLWTRRTTDCGVNEYNVYNKTKLSGKIKIYLFFNYI